MIAKLFKERSKRLMLRCKGIAATSLMITFILLFFLLGFVLVQKYSQLLRHFQRTVGNHLGFACVLSFITFWGNIAI